MKTKMKSLISKVSILLFTFLMLFSFQSIWAYSYETNLLSVTSKESNGKTLSYSETIQLSEVDIVRANKGDLYYTSYAHLGANGSRTVTPDHVVQCKNSNGEVLHTYDANPKNNSTYWVKHADYKYNSGNITIPAGTTQITYSASIHIGTSGSLELWEMNIKLYDNVAPGFIAAVTSTASGTYPSNTTIRYKINFNEAIGSVINSGTVKTNIGNATYAGISNDRMSLYYDYTITPSSSTVSNYNIVKISSISNLTVKDDAGNSVTVNKSSLVDNFGIYMDNKFPSITSFTTEASGNSYFSAGENIVFNVTFDENITVNQNPYILLSNGNKAIYKKGTDSDTNIASFVYTVGSKDTNTNQIKISSIDFTEIVDKVNQSATGESSYSSNMYNSFLDNYNIGIDTNAPIVTFTDPTSIYHDDNYVVKIDSSDSISGIKELYSAWTINDTEPIYPSSSNVSSNNEIQNPATSGMYYLWIKAVDNAGNSTSIKSPYIYYFDLKPPTITMTPCYVDGFTAVSAVNIIVNDDINVVSKKYVWKDSNNVIVAEGEVNSEIIYPDVDGIYSLTVTAIDGVGNVTTHTLQDISMDKNGPNAIFTPNSNNQWSKSYSVSVLVSDEKTGVKSLEYQWSLSENAPTSGWIETTDTTFTTPNLNSGTCYLHIKAKDFVGNEQLSVSGGFNIDNVPPTVEITPNGNASYLVQDEYEIGIIIQDAITAYSDLNKSYVFSPSETSDKLTFLPLTSEVVTLSNYNSNTYLYIKISDEAGNETLFKSKAFIADTVSPEGTIVYNSSKTINKSFVDISFTVTDDYTSNDDIEMQLIIDGTEGMWESFSSNKTIVFDATEGTHSVSVRFKDKSKNISNLYTVKFVYDITPPEIIISYVPDVPTNGNVIATASTEVSGHITSENVYEFLENGSYTFRAVDEAGNISQKNAVVNWIDKISPTISFVSEEFDNKKHRESKITINCIDNANGITMIKYRIVKDGTEISEWVGINNNDTVEISGVTDGTYNIEAMAIDGVGNETIQFSEHVYIDVTPPVASIIYSVQTRTAQNVESIVKFNEIVSITNNNKSNSYLFEDNGEFIFEFEDEAGNKSTALAKVNWIDREIPEAKIIIKDESYNSVNQDKWSNKNLYVTIVPPSQSIINELTFNGEFVADVTSGSSINSDIIDCGNNTYLISTYGEMKFIVHDTETSLESEGAVTVRIDKKAPEIEKIMRTTTDWTNKDVVVTITANDDLSNVSYTNSNSYTFTNNGSHTFYFVDEAGNSNSYIITVNNIDKDAPVANISFFSEGNPYNMNFTNKDITVIVDFESLSPVKITNNGGRDSYKFSSNGEFTFEFIDDAGNRGSKTVTIDKIDKIVPDAYVTYSTSSWTNKDVIATLHVIDEQSGGLNDGETFVFTENGEYEFVASDNAGNTTKVKASTTRIDKVPPKLSYSISPMGKTPYSVFATVTSDENVIFLNNGGRPSIQFKTNGSFTFKAQDYAGNISEITVEVNNISIESTPVVIDYSTIEPTSDDVYVTIYPEDKKNDVIFVINNDNNKTYKFKENGEFVFVYRNPSGITGEAIASVSNIDKNPPVVTVQYSSTELTNENVVATLNADKDVIYPFVALNGRYIFEKNEKVLIPVKDKMGNVTNVLLEVSWIDKDAPVIVLENQHETISIGDHIDLNAGVSVTDYSGVLRELQIIGQVDTNKAGVYEIRYLAKDMVGNIAEITKYVTVYDPNEFNVIINGKMPVNQEVEIMGNNMTLETVNKIGNLKLLCAQGKKNYGYFKKNGNEITKDYVFEEKGYYTLYIQDENRNTKLVYVFVK